MEAILGQVNLNFLELLLWLLVPVLLSIFALTVLSSFLQSFFSVNDYVITFVLKLALVVVISLSFGPKALSKVKNFSVDVFSKMDQVLR